MALQAQPIPAIQENTPADLDKLDKVILEDMDTTAAVRVIQIPDVKVAEQHTQVEQAVEQAEEVLVDFQTGTL
jgi:hypothetical protein